MPQGTAHAQAASERMVIEGGAERDDTECHLMAQQATYKPGRSPAADEGSEVGQHTRPIAFASAPSIARAVSASSRAMPVATRAANPSAHVHSQAPGSKGSNTGLQEQ